MNQKESKELPLIEHFNWSDDKGSYSAHKLVQPKVEGQRQVAVWMGDGAYEEFLKALKNTTINGL